MSVMVKDQWEQVVETLDFTEDGDLAAMHMSEIEEEASDLLDLLITLRVNGREDDRERAELTAVDLSVSLSHLLHHIQELLPLLEKQLDIEETEDIEVIEP